MTEKQKIIDAIKDLDFKKLNLLLDDNISYMDVSKKRFLNALKREIKKQKGLKAYDIVEEGICNFCKKGCKAYKFKTENQPSLNILFEESDNRVTDIYLCGALKVDDSNEDDWHISFSFYEEEKVNFSNSVSYLINLQRIEKAIEEFKKLAITGLVPIQEVVYWFEKMNNLANDLKLNDPFLKKNYKAHETIDNLYLEVEYLVKVYKKFDLAQAALKKYHIIDKNDEKSIVKWLLENKNNYSFSLEKTDNWEKTGILILKTEPNLVVDCSDYLEPFLCDDIYNNHYNELMEKYEPTNEHYEENGECIEYSLETYLKFHHKYLDLF